MSLKSIQFLWAWAAYCACYALGRRKIRFLRGLFMSGPEWSEIESETLMEILSTEDDESLLRWLFFFTKGLLLLLNSISCSFCSFYSLVPSIIIFFFASSSCIFFSLSLFWVVLELLTADSEASALTICAEGIFTGTSGAAPLLTSYSVGFSLWL